MVMLVGVQSNQFPRALDIAAPLCKRGIQVGIGGFHVSGTIAMLKERDSDVQRALDMGVSLFAGEAEGRFAQVLKDALDGRLQPLGIPEWSDKLVGEVVRLLLEAYYEPGFSDRSHGFRKGRGCHTALREIRENWTGTTWFIEGDIRDCLGAWSHCSFR